MAVVTLARRVKRWCEHGQHRRGRTRISTASRAACTGHMKVSGVSSSPGIVTNAGPWGMKLKLEYPLLLCRSALCGMGISFHKAEWEGVGGADEDETRKFDIISILAARVSGPAEWFPITP